MVPTRACWVAGPTGAFYWLIWSVLGSAGPTGAGIARPTVQPIGERFSWVLLERPEARGLFCRSYCTTRTPSQHAPAAVCSGPSRASSWRGA
jgi:hypothetical protein